MSKSTTVNKNGLTSFANGRYQSLLQSTRMGWHPLLMVDIKVYYSQQEWVDTLCLWWISKSTTVNDYGFTPFANGRWQSLLQSTSIANDGCQSLLQSTSMGSHTLLMMDVKVYYNQQEYIATFAESICIYKFDECIPENVLFECWQLSTCKSTMNVYLELRFNMYTLFQQIGSNKIIKNYIFNWLI